MQDRELRVIGDDFDLFEAILKCRKERIAFNLAFYERQIQIRAQRQHLFVNLRAATNEHLARLGIHFERLQVWNRDHSRMRKRAAAHDDGFAVWQDAPDRFKRSPTHYDGVAGRHLLEPLEILGQMPRDFITVTDDSVQGHRRDRFRVLHRMLPVCAGLVFTASSVITPSQSGTKLQGFAPFERCRQKLSFPGSPKWQRVLS